ncbi:MAG: MlaD family protein [Rhodothermia bacterium]|nr:MAG: MlaD family protein [Rhodothermia bacterium]
MKVGVTLIVTIIVFVLGVRYFQDLPLFQGTFHLVSEFDDAGGLISGNLVRINGVGVGSVDDVFINPATQRVRVEFHVDNSIPITEGSTSQIAGFEALGVVRLDVNLGPADAPVIPEYGLVEGIVAQDILGTLSEKAPALVDRIEATLETLNSVLGEAGSLLSEPDSDIRQTLVSVQRSAAVLDDFLSSERARLSEILQNMESFTGDMARFSAENTDSLSAVVRNLNRAMASLDRNLKSFELVSASLAEILRKINEGQGTLGLFVNDSGVYEKMDSVLSSLDALLVDFRNNPDKFMKELRLVDIF